MSGPTDPTPRTVFIEQLPIPLAKLLKLENMVSSGAEAKLVIGEGLVRLNGRVETQKGKKIQSGDVVSFQGESIKIV